MKIIMIAAMSKNFVIGNNGKIPWYLPNDIKFFKKKTLGKTIVMGRKTFLNLKKPLPLRENIVLTKKKYISKFKNLHFLNSPKSILEKTKNLNEILIIGGEQIYKIFLPLANEIILTLIDIKVKGDTFFPKWNKKKWKLFKLVNGKLDNINRYKHNFLYFKRVLNDKYK